MWDENGYLKARYVVGFFALYLGMFAVAGIILAVQR